MRHSDVVAARRSLERLGLVEFSGTYRRGQPVWRVSAVSTALEHLVAHGDAEALSFLDDLDTETDDVLVSRARKLAARLDMRWTGDCRR